MPNNCVAVSYGVTNVEAAVVPASLNGGPDYGMFQTLTITDVSADVMIRFSDDQDKVTVKSSILPVTLPAYTETVYLSTTTTATIEMVADIKTWTPVVS